MPKMLVDMQALQAFKGFFTLVALFEVVFFAAFGGGYKRRGIAVRDTSHFFEYRFRCFRTSVLKIDEDGRVLDGFRSCRERALTIYYFHVDDIFE